MADAYVHLMKTYSGAKLINIGTGEDITIAEFAPPRRRDRRLSRRHHLRHLAPDGTPRKLLEVSRLTNFGWRARTPLATA
jgi:GDP-L-fucose synthase